MSLDLQKNSATSAESRQKLGFIRITSFNKNEISSMTVLLVSSCRGRKKSFSPYILMQQTGNERRNSKR